MKYYRDFICTNTIHYCTGHRTMFKINLYPTSELYVQYMYTCRQDLNWLNKSMKNVHNFAVLYYTSVDFPKAIHVESLYMYSKCVCVCTCIIHTVSLSILNPQEDKMEWIRCWDLTNRGPILSNIVLGRFSGYSRLAELEIVEIWM